MTHDPDTAAKNVIDALDHWSANLPPAPIYTHFAPPSMVADFAATARRAIAARAARQPKPAPETASPPKPRTVEQIEAALAAARCGFDPTYPFSDDYGYYCKQDAKAQRIAELTDELERVGK